MKRFTLPVDAKLNVSDEGRKGPVKPTVRDVARVAGVSVATVSNAFNRPERLASATRERVLATAAELGYLGPHPAARSLRLGKRGTVALATAGLAEGVFADPAATLIARGVARACDQAGVGLVLGGDELPYADGVVFVRHMEPTCAPGQRVVIVDGPPLDDAPRVEADVHAGAAEVAAHLAALGNCRLAILGTAGSDDRLRGALVGWGDAGSALGYRTEQLTRDHGEAAARAALAVSPRPDAILGLSDVLAWGALDAAHRAGLAVPGDLSVAGIGDLEGSEAMGLTSAFVPYRAMGDLAGMLLAALVAEEPVEVPPPFPVTAIIRRSTGPPAPPPGVA